MEIRFDIVGDPWHDWGLCELYNELRNIRISNNSVVVSSADDAGFTISTELNDKDLGILLAKSIGCADRWNKLHPRYEEAKKIERCYPKIEDGRRVPGVKYDPKVSKEEWNSCGCNGEIPKLVRNSVLRLPTIPMTPKLLAPYFDDCASSNKGILQYSNSIRNSEYYPITQSINPMVAKHHSNSDVRGFSGTNNYPSNISKYIMACLCASLSPQIPFVKTSGSGATLLLPECHSFAGLYKLWSLIHHGGVVRHPDSNGGSMRTNLKFFAEGKNAQLLILLNCLQDDLSLTEDNDDPLSDEEIKQFTDWITIEIGSGTNVRIGSIKKIKIPSNVFDLLKPIPKPKWLKADDNISFVKDCFISLYFDLYPLQDKLASALFKVRINPDQCWGELSQVAFQAYKNINNAKVRKLSARLLPHFYLHFAKEITKMTGEQILSCKKLGELAGAAFSNDVTLLSRLHNASSPNDFRENIELLAFRLFKLSSGNKPDSIWHISADEVHELLKMADTQDWKQAATTISTFASLRAFNKNIGEQK